VDAGAAAEASDLSPELGGHQREHCRGGARRGNSDCMGWTVMAVTTLPQP
jgi:uncharacterized membrane protein